MNVYNNCSEVFSHLKRIVISLIEMELTKLSSDVLNISTKVKILSADVDNLLHLLIQDEESTKIFSQILLINDLHLKLIYKYLNKTHKTEYERIKVCFIKTMEDLCGNKTEMSSMFKACYSELVRKIETDNHRDLKLTVSNVLLFIYEEEVVEEIINQHFQQFIRFIIALYNAKDSLDFIFGIVDNIKSEMFQKKLSFNKSNHAYTSNIDTKIDPYNKMTSNEQGEMLNYSKDRFISNMKRAEFYYDTGDVTLIDSLTSYIENIFISRTNMSRTSEKYGSDKQGNNHSEKIKSLNEANVNAIKIINESKRRDIEANSTSKLIIYIFYLLTIIYSVFFQLFLH